MPVNTAASLLPVLVQAAAHDFDVVGHPHQKFHFTTCLPFHPSLDGIRPAEVRHRADTDPAVATVWRGLSPLLQVSIVYEYSQGTNQMMYAVAAGGFDPTKHADFKACCRAELGEEVGALRLHFFAATLTQRCC